MCNRNTQDPLLRIFLDKYNLNLLSIPREKATVGDLYVHDGKRVSTPGSVTYFLDPPMKMPTINAGESMADVTGKITNRISIDVGFGLLEGFLSVMGAASFVTRIRASYEAKKAKALRFRYTQAVRDSVDVMRVGSMLIRRKIKEGHALYSKDMRYYLVTAVARSPSISVTVESEDTKLVNIDIGFLNAAKTSIGVSAAKSEEGEVTYSGEKNLAFGVELYELQYDTKRNTLKLALPTGAIQVRGARTPVAKPAFIGGPQESAFISIQ